ncbi:hypothetical protein F442_22722 [Phytophthora nicotianae P10297]|uniref:Uncharacterized protein n=1 Tax=Phytophthora nicotianae P10297 TaxID=1317064 RepID=W2Y023_PHYNI|nr:hypothetical protein F442_22722 [Phytophthora nicotianae P10297]
MTASQVSQETTARHQGEQIEGDASTDNSAVMAMTVPRVPQPIFAIVNAPLIANVSREALLEWLRLCKEYEAVIEVRCRAANEDVKAVMRSVRNSFDENRLETMCEMRWDADFESVTNAFLMKKIKEITTSFMNKELHDMDDLFSDE